LRIVTARLIQRFNNHCAFDQLQTVLDTDFLRQNRVHNFGARFKNVIRFWAFVFAHIEMKAPCRGGVKKFEIIFEKI
jgi:hypothetical protein